MDDKSNDNIHNSIVSKYISGAVDSVCRVMPGSRVKSI